MKFILKDNTMFADIFKVVTDLISNITKDNDTGDKTRFNVASGIGSIISGGKFGAPANIAKEAKRNIGQFPIIISNAIGDDQALKICEIVERTIADMILLCIQNGNNLLDLNNPEEKRKFIDSYTNAGNSSIDFDSISYGAKAFASDYKTNCIGLDAMTLKRVANEAMILEDMPIVSSFEMSTLFNPCKSVAEEFEMGAVAPVSVPMGVATGDNNDEDNEYDDQVSDDIASEATNTKKSNAKKSKPVFGANQLGNNQAKVNGTSSNKIEEKVSKLSPTIVNATVILQTKTDTLERNLAFGVKVNAHEVSSDELVKAIKETYSSSSLIARLIRWRSGELSFFKDVLLNLKEIKQTVAARNNRNTKNGLSGLFASMRFMHKNALAVNTLSSNGALLPTVSIMLNLDEVEMIKNSCGKDLFKNMKDARELCAKLGLFGILIVDSANDSFYSFFNDDATLYKKTSLKDNKNKNSDDVVKAIFGALKR